MHYRGVAQLIARSVWDREVEGLSPFTPTIEKDLPCVGLFLCCDKSRFFDSTALAGEVEGLLAKATRRNLFRAWPAAVPKAVHDIVIAPSFHPDQ